MHGQRGAAAAALRPLRGLQGLHGFYAQRETNKTLHELFAVWSALKENKVIIFFCLCPNARGQTCDLGDGLTMMRISRNPSYHSGNYDLQQQQQHSHQAPRGARIYFGLTVTLDKKRRPRSERPGGNA